MFLRGRRRIATPATRPTTMGRLIPTTRRQASRPLVQLATRRPRGPEPLLTTLGFRFPTTAPPSARIATPIPRTMRYSCARTVTLKRRRIPSTEASRATYGTARTATLVTRAGVGDNARGSKDGFLFYQRLILSSAFGSFRPAAVLLVNEDAFGQQSMDSLLTVYQLRDVQIHRVARQDVGHITIEMFLLD